MTTKQFYLLCLIGITFIGGMLMFLLWRQIKLKSSENRGMLFISLAMFSWTLVGIYKFSDPPMPSLINAINDRILSAFSNMFLLASLPYFPNVFEDLKERFSIFRKPDQWINSIFIFFAIITVIFTLIDRSVESDPGRKAIIAVDSLISTTTILLISIALYQSLSRFWSDKVLKVFLAVMFILLISTQVILPMIAIFPEIFRPFYLYALVLLLLGLTFFNFVSIAYFGMVNMEMTAIADIEYGKSKKAIYNPDALKVGYDKQRKLYFVRIGFISSVEPAKVKEIEVSTSKLLQPFANWVLFALARKHDCKLSNQDLSTSKFRMVEFWNRDGEIKLTQEQVFNNDRGFFDLKIEISSISIEDPEFLRSKFIIREAVLKHEDNFEKLAQRISAEKSFSRASKQEQLIQYLFDSMNS
ncbi:MAG: hypothetical protein ACK46O_09820 [Flavobacteriia bacterium]|jgi:hypothetical protein